MRSNPILQGFLLKASRDRLGTEAFGQIIVLAADDLKYSTVTLVSNS